MTTIKTAISIDKPLFDQLGDLAQELNTSRSRIFALAATEYIQRHKNLKLLDAINAACNDLPDEKEASLISAMKTKQSKMVNDKW